MDKQIEEADIKNIEKLIEWSEDNEINLTELFLQDEQVTKSLKRILSLAQLFLSVSEKMPQKYGYLHSKEGCQCDSCKIVNIKNLCHDEFTAWLVPIINKFKNLTQAVRNYADIGNKQFNQDEEEFWKMCEVNDEVATAIKTMIMGNA